MEATQAIDFSLDSSELCKDDHDTSGNHPKRIVGVLQFDEDQLEYNAFQGDIIKIGRDSENCQVVLENKVSKYGTKFC